MISGSCFIEMCGTKSKEINLKKYPLGSKILGKGTQGEIILKKNIKGREIAVKHVKSTLSEFFREVSALKALQGHPNIIKMIGFSFEDRKIALEVAQISLYSALRELKLYKDGGDTPLTKKLIFQIIKGVYYMNSVGIWHRDLKPENILIFPENVVKITDFGSSRGGPFQWISTTGVVYTLYYRAPEILLQEIINPVDFRDPSIYTSKAEVFALGICLWDILNGSDISSVWYLRTTEPSVDSQIWKFVNGLGFSLFDWCVTNPSTNEPCNYELFLENYTKIGVSAGGKSEKIRNRMNELNDNVNYRCLNILTKKFTLSESLQSLFQALTHPNPNKRISIDDAIHHPYFKSENEIIGSKDDIKKEQIHILEKFPCNILFKNNDIDLDLWKKTTKYIFQDALSKNISLVGISLTYQILICYLKTVNVSREKIIKVGIICLYLSSLYIEVVPPESEEFVEIVTNSDESYEIMKDVFLSIGGLMHLPTPILLLADKIKGMKLSGEQIKPYINAILEEQTSDKYLLGKITSEDIANDISAKIIRTFK
jgi:serine/threonine protein kinase